MKALDTWKKWFTWSGQSFLWQCALVLLLRLLYLRGRLGLGSTLILLDSIKKHIGLEISYLIWFCLQFKLYSWFIWYIHLNSLVSNRMLMSLLLFLLSLDLLIFSFHILFLSCLFNHRAPWSLYLSYICYQDLFCLSYLKLLVLVLIDAMDGFM